MRYETKSVEVCDIIEFPTQLGNRCKLLKTLNMSAYTETDEMITHVLCETAADGNSLDICLNVQFQRVTTVIKTEV